jgi:hypothetical protein
MRKAILFLVLMSLLVGTALAAEDRQTINMKTSDFFIIQFEVENVNNIDLRNCIPLLETSDLELRHFMTFNPEIFNLQPGKSQIVNGRLDDVPVGFYEAEINVKCERYFEGNLVDVEDIVDPKAQPKYEILVSPAGEGQDYVFIPGQAYIFLAKPGDMEQARFTIANTGSKDLDVEIFPEAAYQDIITVTPRKASIRPQERTSFMISVRVPSVFDGLQTNLTIAIGDYTERFQVIGELEVFNLAGSAVAQNIITGQISLGTVQIPTWLVILTILAGGAYLLRDQLFKRKKR